MQGEGYGGTDSWCSPKVVGDGLLDLFGGPVDIDPCSNDRSIIPARRKHDHGGLHIRWMGTGYKNDPYSKSALWVRKAMEELYAGHLIELVSLCMFAPSNGWWIEQCGVWNAHSPRHMLTRTRWDYAGKNRSPNPEIIATKRLKFGGDREHQARFDCALVYYGRRRAAFYKAFAHITKWTTRGRV